jgi:hypothetical protein
VSGSAGHTPGLAAKAFRAELVKIMPGYSWTVHRHTKSAVRITATGIQSSGFNRLSTLQVVRTALAGRVTYTAKSAGFGTRAKWLHENTDATLARALRGLQEHYQRVANTYRSHAARLEAGRRTETTGAEDRGRAVPDHASGPTTIHPEGYSS